MNLDIYYKIFIFIIGLVFGSFYNVVGYRLPNNMSIIKPSSKCPKCGHKLKFYELIPVISYIFLRGKCKSCKSKISIMYPIFELITAVMFLITYTKFGISINFFITIVFVSVLIIISISDLKYFIIPDEVLIIGGILIFGLFITKGITSGDSFINIIKPLLSGIGSFSLFYLIKVSFDFILKKESLGGGDIKLLFIIGMVIGFEMSIVSIFIAAFIALPLSVVSLIKKDETIIPFGPYLSLASIIILFFNLNMDKILDFFIK